MYCPWVSLYGILSVVTQNPPPFLGVTQWPCVFRCLLFCTNSWRGIFFLIETISPYSSGWPQTFNPASASWVLLITDVQQPRAETFWVPQVFQQEPGTPSSSRPHLKCLNSAAFHSQFSPPVEAPDAQVRELIAATRLGSEASLLSWLSLWSEASISTNKCAQITGGGKQFIQGCKWMQMYYYLHLCVHTLC